MNEKIAHNVMPMMPQNYDDVWQDLNDHLNAIRQDAGNLDAVFRALDLHQHKTGFIKDRFEEIARFKFYHPQDPSRFLRVQFNPKRALRLKGIGIKTPPPDISITNNGCYLCRDNIAWQQQGAELGYDMEINGSRYVAWMNPFPLLPTHVVVSSTEHRTQEWIHHRDGGLEVSEILNTLVTLSAQAPGYIGFYNGVGAGASIPEHMHIHFCQRPDDDPLFPLELVQVNFSRDTSGAGLVENYPLAVAVWRGTTSDVLKTATEWLSEWAQRNQPRLANMTANFIATTDPDTDQSSLYFAPRERNRIWRGGISDLIGGLEVMGEFVYTIKEEKVHLEGGIVDYFTLEKILTDIHTPLYG